MQARRSDVSQHDAVVAPKVANGGIEWRKQPLVRGRKHNDSAARAQKRRRIFHFFAIILDMFQDVDINDGVKFLSFVQILDRADHSLV